MEKIIRELNTRLQQMLPAGKTHLNISDFRAAGLPAPLIDRIQLEIFQHLDRSLALPRTDWVDMSDSSVQQAWMVFMLNLRNHSQLPTSHKADIFTNAVSDVVQQLVEPRIAFPKQLFEDEHALTYEQLQQRSQKIVVYRHLVVGLLRYMDRRNLRVLPIEKCKDVLSQIDHKFCEDYTPMNWAQLLTPWFDFFGKRIPVDLLRRFFSDKRNTQLTQAFPETLIDLNKTEIIERLSAPDLPVSYHKMDDPEREEKLAQRIQPLENAGTYYEEFLKLREANRQKWATILDDRMPSTRVELAELEDADELLPQNESDLHSAFVGEKDHTEEASEIALNETFTEVENENIEKTNEYSEHTEESPQKSEPEATDEHQEETAGSEEDVQLLENDTSDALNSDDEESISEEGSSPEASLDENGSGEAEEMPKKSADLSFHDLAEEGILDELDDLDDLEDIDAMMASIEKEEEIVEEEPTNEAEVAEKLGEDPSEEENELDKLLAEQEEKLRLKTQKTAPEVEEEPAASAASEDDDEDDTDFDMDALFAGNSSNDDEEKTAAPEVEDEPAASAASEDDDEDDTDFDMDALFAGNSSNDDENKEEATAPELEEEPTASAASEIEDEDDTDFDMDALFAGNSSNDDEDKEEATAPEIKEESATSAASEDEDEDDTDFDMDALFAGNSSNDDEDKEEATAPEIKEEPTTSVTSEDEDEDDTDFDMDALFAGNSSNDDENKEEAATPEIEEETSSKAAEDDINAMFSDKNETEEAPSRGIESLFSDDDSSVDDVLNQAARSLEEHEGLLEYLIDYHDYFIRELFDGSAEAFSQCVEDVDSFEHWPEASEYLNNDIFSAYGIDMISEPAIKLIDELQTYFASYKAN